MRSFRILIGFAILNTNEKITVSLKYFPFALFTIFEKFVVSHKIQKFRFLMRYFRIQIRFAFLNTNERIAFFSKMFPFLGIYNFSKIGVQSQILKI